jgi:lipid II isoglutaminyl synthase (glutamine-hydrolysing)
MGEHGGRHESHDPGETLILPAVAGPERQVDVRPAAGRHAFGNEGPSSSAERSPQRSSWDGEDPVWADRPLRSAAGQFAPAADDRTDSLAGTDGGPPGPEEPRGQAEEPRGQADEPRRVAGGSQLPDLKPGQRAPSAAATRTGGGQAGRSLKLVWVYPDLLSTYGDRGNLLVLKRRAELRGHEVEAIEVKSDEPVPDHGDLYLLGGGEDLPQILAARRLLADSGLNAAAERGAVVFAVCAGYQLLGREFGGVEGEPMAGLGILDITSGRGEQRGVGEIVADVDPALGVPRLTGFENHQGVTSIGPGARPLGRVTLGVGNGDGTEGAYAGNVLGTYLHGPVLARNPGLADLLLSWVVGPLEQLRPGAEEWARQLREERLAAVSA